MAHAKKYREREENAKFNGNVRANGRLFVVRRDDQDQRERRSAFTLF